MSKLNRLRIRKRDLRKKNKFKKSRPKPEFSARHAIIFLFILFVLYCLFIIYRNFNYTGVKKSVEKLIAKKIL